jgi:HlyD family secretion protein
MKKFIIIGSIAVILIIMIWIIARGNNSSDQEGIKLEKVKKDNVIVKALAIGQIIPKQEISIKSNIPGIVSKRYVEIGDRVKRGDPLIKIDPDPTPIEYTQAKRDAELAEIFVKKAELEYNRAVEMKNKNLISANEFENYQKQFDEKKLNHQLSQEKFDLISTGKIQLSGKQIENIIKSPIDGTILELFVNQGDPVVPLTSYQAGTSIMTMADMGNLIFKGTVDEIDVGKIKEGTIAQLKIGALPDVNIEGTVVNISPKAKKEGNSTLFDIEIKIADENHGDAVMRAGLSANADVIIQRADSVLIIPERLIQYENDSAYVEIKKDEKSSVIEKRSIKIGISDGMITEIDSGLAENELVVERPPREIQ